MISGQWQQTQVEVNNEMDGGTRHDGQVNGNSSIVSRPESDWKCLVCTQRLPVQTCEAQDQRPTCRWYQDVLDFTFCRSVWEIYWSCASSDPSCSVKQWGTNYILIVCMLGKNVVCFIFWILLLCHRSQRAGWHSVRTVRVSVRLSHVLVKKFVTVSTTEVA